jgi:hypothetical protein
MKTNYVLVDCENVQSPALSLLKGEQFRVWIFLGQNNTKLKKELVLAMQQLRDRLEIIDMAGSGKNALDFHIAYYLGFLSREDSNGFFHIISGDKGFDPLIAHLRSKHVFAARSESIEGMPCLQPPKKANVSRNEKELLDLVIADLRKRKASKPGKLKTLLGTIRAVCGKELPDSKIDSVFKSLVKRSSVKVEGTKVQFTGL